MSSVPANPDLAALSLDNWQEPPFNRWAFSHVNELVSTQPISRGDGPVFPLPAEPRGWEQLEVVRSDGQAATVGEVWEETYTDAVAVVHGGALVLEHYAGETRPETNHLLMSVSKSLVSCVLGCLVEQGALAPEDLVTDHVPELLPSGYAGARVRDLLDMRSGVAFSELYGDPMSHVRLIERAYGWRPAPEGQEAGSLYQFLTTLQGDQEHGGTFRYRSCETDVLGWVCERAAGQPMADLLSSLIWAPIGAEFDAEVSCDPAGTAIHDGGICSSARDLARFGLMLLGTGRLGERQVVPERWLRSAWTVDADIRDAFAQSENEPYMPGGWYRNQFWFEPRRVGDVQLCLGIYGQMVYVNPFTGLVAAKLSSWPAAQSPALLEDTLRTFDALGEALSARTPPTHEGLPGVAAGLSRRRASHREDPDHGEGGA